MKPFVDYYRKLGISPVKQDITDLDRHYSRREALYRQLGIPAVAIRGAQVIEFGPGSGHNALYTASLGPARYVLVDANPNGTAEMRALFSRYEVPAAFEIVDALIEEYPSSERFAFVFAEGFIPYSHDPVDLARRVGAFAGPGGVLTITCADPAAVLGEILRRFVARRFVELDRPPMERVERLKPVFTPHLATLHGMTRSVDDWILDNVVHPFTGKLFGIDDALAALGTDFEAYGTSPHFIVDWRWYKQIYGDREYNERALAAFRANVCNLMDYRSALPPHEPALGDALLRCGARIYDLMQRSEIRGELVERELDEVLGEMIARVEPLAPMTAASLASLRAFLAAGIPDLALLEGFAPFFGRGMQYLSLIRRGTP